MDEIKQRYSRRSRQNSSSATRAGSQSKRTPSQVSDSTGTVPSQKPRRVPKFRRASPGAGGDKTTMCTRDEDINIEDFMREDMHQLNKEED